MALHPFSEFITTLKDGVSKALRVKGEFKKVGSGVIKKYENVSGQYYGDVVSTTYGTMIPLDVSEYSNLLIYCKNDDTEARELSIGYYYDNNQGVPAMVLETLGVIEAGESITLFGDETSGNNIFLIKPIAGLMIQTTVPNNGLTVVFMGER